MAATAPTMGGMPQYVRAGNEQIQVEVVGPDGTVVTQPPVNVEDLLRQEGHRVDIGNGVSLQLEEFNPDTTYSEETSDDEEDYSEDDIDDDYSDENEDAPYAGGGSAPPLMPPPGTTEVKDWYSVLNALRSERGDVLDTQMAIGATESLALKRHHVRGQHRGKSIDAQPPRHVAAPPGADDALVARRELWASFAPQQQQQLGGGGSHHEERNYHGLHYISVLGAAGADARQFRPNSLSFHAMTSYLSSKDRCQRVLVYGGISHGGRTIEKELYEFSLLTGNWRRVEGKQFVPAGHYGHSMTVVEASDKLVLVGGVGPGGIPVQEGLYNGEPFKASRAQLLLSLAHEGTQKARRVAHPSLPTAAASEPGTTTAALVGFVPYMFDMDLSTQRWRAIQTSPIFPLAFHSAVSFGKEVFIFGGLTEELVVSGQLIAVNVETYATRLITTHVPAKPTDAKKEAQEPCPRFLHSAVRYGNFLVIFGGYDARNDALGDTWAFDLFNERWEKLDCHGGTSARAGHTACVVGCRMLVTGGFECGMNEISNSGAIPESNVTELNLVPTLKGQHVWNASLRTRPPLPPLAFATSAPCGDGVSCVVFGGLTPKPKQASRSKSATGAGALRAVSQHSRSPSVSHKTAASPAPHHRQQQHHAHNALDDDTVNSMFNRLITFDDSIVLTFPLKRKHHHTKDGGEQNGTHVNELGVEVDVNEIPEHFKVFMRRQEDFIKKKNAALAETMRKTELQEKESMEPTLYLTDDEIALLCEKSEECCTCLSEAYKISDLPSNVPDREARVKIMEECISLSRQARDVIKSMKGSVPGVTAVKSKTHRKRAGQKFEDYSAAKPLRHAVITQLLHEINHELSRMHRYNKALRTVEWEDKEKFAEAVASMQASVDALSRAINHVMNRYVQNRVKTLMKGVDKHKEVMRLLTEIVTRNRHDKIFAKDEQPDAQRERVKRVWAQGDKGDSGGAGKQQKQQQQGEQHPERSGGGCRSRRKSSKYMGVGYHRSEEEASIELLDKDWKGLCDGAEKVSDVAKVLAEYCRVHNTGGAATAASPHPSSGAEAAPIAQQSLQVEQALGYLVAPTPAFIAPQDSFIPPPVAQSGDAGLPPPILPPPSFTHGSVLAPPTTTAEPQPSPAVAGAVSNREIVIRHSNALRGATAAVADAVGQAALEFIASLEKEREKKEAESRKKQQQQKIQTQSSTAVTGTYAGSGNSPLDSPTGADVQPISSNSTGFLPIPVSTTVPALGVSPALPVGNGVSTVLASPPALATGVDSATKNRICTSPQSKSPQPQPAKTSAAHTLHLRHLRPLMEAREKFFKVAEKAPLVRVNEWDANNTAGAPQDTRVEKLCKRLSAALTSLLQRATSSFLSQAGAKKKNPQDVDQTKAAMRRTSGKTTTASSRSRSQPTAAVKSGSAKKTACSSKKRSGRSHSGSSSSSSSSRNSRSYSSDTFTDDDIEGNARAQYSAAPLGPRRVQSVHSASTTVTTMSKSTAARSLASTRKVPASATAKAESRVLEALHMPPRAYMADLSVAVAAAASSGDCNVQQLRDANARAQTVAIASGVSIWEDGSVVNSTDSNLSLSSCGLPGREPPRREIIAVVEPAKVCAVHRIPNTAVAPITTTPGAATLVSSDFVVSSAGSRGRYANEWAIASAAKIAAAAGTALGSPLPPPATEVTAAGANAVLTPLYEHEALPFDTNMTILKSTGPVVHIPETPLGARCGKLDDGAEAGSPRRRSTIATLSHINGSEPESMHIEEPATSIAPGTFVVNPDYFYKQSGVSPSAGQAAVPTSNSAPASGSNWADAEDDYFYFGKRGTSAAAIGGSTLALSQTHDSGEGTAGAAALFGIGAFQPSVFKEESSKVRQPPAVSTTVGLMLPWQRVTAERKDTSSSTRTRSSSAKARLGIGGGAAAAPNTSSTVRVQAAATAAAKRREEQMAAAATARSAAASSRDPVKFRGTLTPGELQIMQARERLRRK